MSLSSSAAVLRRLPMSRGMSVASSSTATSLQRKTPSSSFSPRHEEQRQSDGFGFTSRTTRTTRKPVPTPTFRLRSDPPPKSQKRKNATTPKETHSVELLGPFHDEEQIRSQYLPSDITPPNPRMLESPKNAIINYRAQQLDAEIQRKQKSGRVGGKNIIRVTINLSGVLSGDLVGVGDSTADAKAAEKLAYLSLLYQMHASGQLYAEDSATHTTLSDNTKITLEQAENFIEFYCRKFNFAEPYSSADLRPGSKSIWDCYMKIEGRKIGLGSGTNKKIASQKCKLDVAQYLEKSDPALWREYVEKQQNGESLGDAPPMWLYVPKVIRNDIRDLCVDLHHSQLYKSNASHTLTPARLHHEPHPVPTTMSLQQKSQFLLKRQQQYLLDASLDGIRHTRKLLPVNSHRDDIIDTIETNDVSIFMAATGSGKSTQIPQMILDHFIHRGQGANCNVFCTQPRRLAAVGVAVRVAAERGEALGQSVGYAVRFEQRFPDDHGSITFCTVGLFLKKLQQAFSGVDSMETVTHIVVDEVHERDIDTDLLLVVLKRYLADRKARGIPLKIILMSATIDPTLFQNYFPTPEGIPAPVVEISGRSFPVEKHFLDDFIPSIKAGQDAWALREPNIEKYLHNERTFASSSPGEESQELDIPFHLVAATISHVLRGSDEGHVLVFLPGLEEILRVERLLSDPRWAVKFTDRSQYEIHLLHSSIPFEKQQMVFAEPRQGIRRIILSTNIAETSLTIPDVVYVVDSARLKEKRYDPSRHMTSLVTAWIGRSNLNQRAGRAGRHRNGFYYGLLSNARAETLSYYQTVEMARADLTNVVMRIKAMDFPRMRVQDVLAAAIEPPDVEQVKAALNNLRVIGALDDRERLTALGRILMQLPLDAHLGRLVLYGCFFRCLDEAVTLAAILSSRDPWMTPPNMKREAQRVRESWVHPDHRSDALTTLRAYNAWAGVMQRRPTEGHRFLAINFLSRNSMQTIDQTRQHLIRALGQAGILGHVSLPSGASVSRYTVPPTLNENAGSYPTLTALISIACQAKIAVPISALCLRTRQDKRAIIHPSSVNTVVGSERKNEMSILLGYLEKRNNPGSGSVQPFLSNTTYIPPLVYLLFGSHKQELGKKRIRCDNWIIFETGDDAEDVLRLRQYLNRALLRFFAGVALTGQRPLYADQDSDDESPPVQPLSDTEKRELLFLCRDVVRILDKYTEERLKFWDSIKRQ